MPGRDGTGPLGLGPCGKLCSECPKKHDADRSKKAPRDGGWRPKRPGR